MQPLKDDFAWFRDSYGFKQWTSGRYGSDHQIPKVAMIFCKYW